MRDSGSGFGATIACCCGGGGGGATTAGTGFGTGDGSCGGVTGVVCVAGCEGSVCELGTMGVVGIGVGVGDVSREKIIVGTCGRCPQYSQLPAPAITTMHAAATVP